MPFALDDFVTTLIGELPMDAALPNVHSVVVVDPSSVTSCKVGVS